MPGLSGRDFAQRRKTSSNALPAVFKILEALRCLVSRILLGAVCFCPNRYKRVVYYTGGISFFCLKCLNYTKHTNTKE